MERSRRQQFLGQDCGRPTKTTVFASVAEMESRQRWGLPRAIGARCTAKEELTMCWVSNGRVLERKKCIYEHIKVIDADLEETKARRQGTIQA